MQLELLKECIGQEATFFVEGELAGFKGTILAIEENWVKIDEKNNTRFVNGDMITQVHIRKKK